LPAGQTAITPHNAQADNTKEDAMALLWFLVALVIIFAIVGGIAVNNWLWLLLLIALVLLLVGAF
jgi:diacylglycerol kinase